MAGFEYHFAALVSLDRDGEIQAVVGEDVAEKYWSRRYGAPEPEFTGGNIFFEDQEIELTAEEIEEGRQGIETISRVWSEEISRLRNIFRPTTGKEVA